MQDINSVHGIVERWAQQEPGRIALVEGERRWSYAALQSAIEAAAAWLTASGVCAGDRVMLVCENSCAAIALYFACTKLEAWPVPVNARLSDREIEEIVAHCKPRRIVFATECSTQAAAHAKRRGAAPHQLDGVGTLALGALHESATPEPTEADPQGNIAALIYTTGTTGKPKGVMLTHRNLLFVARATAEARHLNPDDRIYATLPITHTLGLTGVMLGSLVAGAQVHIASRFDPAKALAALANDGITAVIGTPSMYAMLAEYAKRKGTIPIRAPALRLISSAGAPLDLATKATVEAAFGQTLHNGYGITECGPSISLTALDAPRNDCSVGRLLPGIETKLIGGNGDAGELWVKTPGIMKGYYGAPAETAQAIEDGWFRTGDLARLEDGNLFIVGRAKELIIRFGFNVYPAEVEAVLNEHPAVLRSAVVGRQANGTEEIVAFVQLNPGASADTAAIADHAAARLTPHKRPTEIVVVDAMPMSAGGKILKAQLVPTLAAPLRREAA
ncbi:MAG TPA: AMP-binding protein [Rhizomicrobium sp.]|jgi:acyl-CoA synthetase (AMP-forming)/AMP-acid ligase II